MRAIPRGLAIQRKKNGNNFLLNAIDLGTAIVLPWPWSDTIPSDLRRWLTEGGIHIIYRDFSEFAKSGAGIRCATFVIEK